jgi:biotin carboxyl carrier protein
MRFDATLGEETFQVEVLEDAGRYRVRVGETWLEVDLSVPPTGPWSLLVGGESHAVDVHEGRDAILVTLGTETYSVRIDDAGRRARPGRGGPAGPAGERLTAPMPGRVVSVHVAVGDRVARGAPLVVIEAMKMENEFRAGDAGLVLEVGVIPGQAVNAGDLLVVLGPDDGAPAPGGGG